MCEPFRNGAFDAIKSRMACSALLPCALRAAPRRRGFSIAVGSALGVRVPSKNERFTQPPNLRPHTTPVILKVPTFSPQLEQYNRVRGSSAKHATGGPKSRKLHYGEFVGLTYVSPPNPRIKARFQRAALEPFGVSFFDIFLHAKKDIATGGRWFSREFGKNVQRKMESPKGAGNAERSVISRTQHSPRRSSLIHSSG